MRLLKPMVGNMRRKMLLLSYPVHGLAIAIWLATWEQNAGYKLHSSPYVPKILIARMMIMMMMMMMMMMLIILAKCSHWSSATLQ